MKKLITLALFLCASTWAFAQYNHVEVGPNGNKTEEGQYNANPGINAGDSKAVIAQKMSVIYKIGTWRYWHENGQLAAEEQYDNSGNPTGIWKTWYNNGTLESVINKTTGAVTYYHPNGQKSEEGTINVNNQRVGSWQGWHENGNLNYRGDYNSVGQKNGAWQYYDSNGTIYQTQQYVNDVLTN
jgi:antitoxin component YwqK of YwqJK toxin-antitoxin module